MYRCQRISTSHQLPANNFSGHQSPQVNQPHQGNQPPLAIQPQFNPNLQNQPAPNDRQENEAQEEYEFDDLSRDGEDPLPQY